MYFANTDSGRHSVEVRHNDIHKNKIESVYITVNFVDGFQSICLCQVSTCKSKSKSR